MMGAMSNGHGAGSAVSPLQFFREGVGENPFPLLAQLRAAGPIVSLPLPGGATGARGQQVWLVTRLEEAVEILRDKRFTVDGMRLVGDGAGQARRREGSPGEGMGVFGLSMIAVDEPDHKRLRGLVSKAFTPRYIESLRPHIQRIADDLLDGVAGAGQMDLVRAYAYPLPINVISDMLGVPAEMRDAMRLWSEALTNRSEEDAAERALRIGAFSRYVGELVEEKRRHPADDLISQLVALDEEGDHLSEGELFSMVGLLIFAGHETTSNLIGIGTLMLFDYPEELAKLKADFGLAPLAVEELLRFNGPVLTPAPRFAVEDVEVGGQMIHRGDVVMTVLASANRDESQFVTPDALDIARRVNRHIAFGQGIHVCLGAPLARMEGEIAFTRLFGRFPELRLAIPREAVEWRGGLGLRGVASLPVTW